jgi:hypothetical protein
MRTKHLSARYFGNDTVFRIEPKLSKPGWLLLFLRRLHIIHQIRIFSPSFSRGGFCFGFALRCEFCAPALFWSRLFPGLDGFLGHLLNSAPCGRSVLSILTYNGDLLTFKMGHQLIFEIEKADRGERIPEPHPIE